MGQIFKERANALSRLVIFGGPALVFLTGAVFYVFGQSDYLTRVNSPLDQPIPFSHQHHVGGLVSTAATAIPRSLNRPLPGCPRRKLA
jgi:hypothetical protein